MNFKHVLMMIATFFLLLFLAAMPKPVRGEPVDDKFNVRDLNTREPATLTLKCIGDGAMLSVSDATTTYTIILTGELAEALCGKQI